MNSQKHIKSTRKPTSPGEILREDFLVPMGLTQKQLAERIGCDRKVINRIVNGRMAIPVPIARKLATVFNTTPDFWINAQRAVDLYEASKASSATTLSRKLKVSKARAQKAIHKAKAIEKLEKVEPPRLLPKDASKADRLKKVIRKVFDEIHGKFHKTLKNLAK
jgi:addiction module HigA family antidote